MYKINESSKYERFDAHCNNRRITKVIELQESMKKHGFLAAYPLHVRKNGNNKYKIIGGHNRFEAAKSLGVPIKYVVLSDEATIYELERASKTWSLEDFLHSYVMQGLLEYQYCKFFHEKYKIPLQECIHLLQESKVSGKITKPEAFKDGDFTIGDPSFALSVADVIEYLLELEIFFARHTNFVRALRFVMVIPEFDVAHFKRKVSTFPGHLKKQPNTDTYLENIEYVYNYKVKATDKKPLAYYARQAIIERRVKNIRRATKVRMKRVGKIN